MALNLYFTKQILRKTRHFTVFPAITVAGIQGRELLSWYPISPAIMDRSSFSPTISIALCFKLLVFSLQPGPYSLQALPQIGLTVVLDDDTAVKADLIELAQQGFVVELALTQGQVVVRI